MSQWKVSIEEIEIFEHYNAEKLQIGKLGTYQVVVPKDKYTNGEKVVFIPEKSLIPKEIYDGEEFASYLVGTDNNRVKPVCLRGEYSCGVILPINEKVTSRVSNLEVGTDISELLGIKQQQAHIPASLSGDVRRIESSLFGRHDCEHFGVYAKNFEEGERVVITEKVHGSQIIYFYNFENGEEFVSSKGQLGRGLSLKESETNTYWKAIKNDKVSDFIKVYFNTGTIQIFGEVIPVQKGYSYGSETPTIKIFDIRENGKSIPYDQVPNEFKKLWVPVVYDGALNKETVRNFAVGNELVSGRQIHIREGVVVAPYIDRKASYRDSTRLRMKIINPKYKETGEEFS